MQTKIRTIEPFTLLFCAAVAAFIVLMSVIIFKEFSKYDEVKLQQKEMMEGSSKMISNFFARELDKVKSERDSLKILLSECQSKLTQP